MQGVAIFGVSQFKFKVKKSNQILPKFSIFSRLKSHEIQLLLSMNFDVLQFIVLKLVTNKLVHKYANIPSFLQSYDSFNGGKI